MEDQEKLGAHVLVLNGEMFDLCKGGVGSVPVVVDLPEVKAVV